MSRCLRAARLLGLLAITLGLLACSDPNGLMAPDALKAVVPDLPGWDRTAVTAQTIDLPEPATVAGATFTRGNARLDFEISDTKGASGMVESLAAMAGANFHRTLDTGYMKGATVAGSPAIESWNSADRSGELSVLVKKRYIINIGGRGIDDASAMRTLAERMDLARLK